MPALWYFFISWNLFFFVHRSRSSTYVLLCLSLAFFFFSSKFCFNSSIAYEPLETLKLWPAFAIFCLRTLFVKCELSCFIFFKTLSSVTFVFPSDFKHIVSFNTVKLKAKMVPIKLQLHIVSDFLWEYATDCQWEVEHLWYICMHAYMAKCDSSLNVSLPGKFLSITENPR